MAFYDVNRKVLCVDYLEMGKEIVFSTLDHNAICKVSRTDKDVKICGAIDKEPYNTFLPFGTIVYENCQYFFVPYYSDKVAICDSDNNLSSFEVEMTGESFGIICEQNVIKFWNAYSNGRDIVMLGYQYPTILSINSENLEIKYFNEWIKLIPEKYLMNAMDIDWYFGDGRVYINGNIYVPSGIGPGIWRINEKTINIDYIDTGIDTKGFYSIAGIADEFILTSSRAEDKRIFLWNHKTNNIRVVNLPDVVNCSWNAPIIYLGYIYLFPVSAGGRVLRVNIDTCEVEIYGRLDELLLGGRKEEAFMFAVKQKGHFVSFIRVFDRCWFTFDFETDALTENYYLISDEEYLDNCKMELYDNLFEDIVTRNEVFNESDFPLKGFLKNITR